MKRKSGAPKIAVLNITIFASFLVVFLIHQFIFSSISTSSPCSNDSSTVQGNAEETSQLRQPLQLQHITSESIKCDFSHYRYDLCYVNGSTVLNPLTSTLSLLDHMPSDNLTQVFKLRPYPRKWENYTMSRIPELTLTTATSQQHCDVMHSSPALVISTGGYTGNTFHDFNEGFIPLFNTIRTVFPVQTPVVLVIANYRGWWLTKYAELIRQFTTHPIINLDNDTDTHCFPSAAVGLVSHGFMTINPKLLLNAETFYHFRNLVENAYLRDLPVPRSSSPSKPRLVLASRTGDVGRVIRNQAQVIQMAEEIGFEVVLFEPTKYTCMNDAFQLINSSHAMLGVHGAALTHFLFLRPGAVFIQVVPIGIDWLAETCFEKPARDMGIDYMEYKVTLKESSLLEKYGLDYLESHNPDDVMRKDFAYFKETYLQCQDVTPDLERIGQYLKKAYSKAQSFMDKGCQNSCTFNI